MTSFDRESRALLAGISGQPVAWADVAENFDLEKHQTSSANHKLGSIPAWGFDCLRRKDSGSTGRIMDWTGWYADQPLHENEALTPHSAYRVRIDYGSRALAALCFLSGQDQLGERMLARGKASVGWALAGAFTGPACLLDPADSNPQPVSVPHLIVADGPLDQGGVSAPYIAGVGKRGLVREDPPGPGGHFGPFQGLNDGHLRILVAQALTLPYSSSRYSGQHQLYNAIQARVSMMPWGLSPSEVALARAYLRFPQDPTAAREIHSWTLPCLPEHPFRYVRRASGAIELAMIHAPASSTGTKAVEVVMADGRRFIGSPDNGQRGGQATNRQNMQELETIEEADRWRTRWVSGEGKEIFVQRPAAADPIVWSIASERAQSLFLVPGITPQPQPDPSPAPQPQPHPPAGAGALVYLGPGAPGESVYGSRSQRMIVREIHGDPASGWAKRWIAEEKP